MAVADYDDIAARMEAGTANRTVAATRMNATSSRAHTIVGITFVQRAKNAAGETTDKTAVVNLVDLAGRWVSWAGNWVGRAQVGRRLVVLYKAM